MYQVLGDKSAQDEIREKNRNCYHCPWLKRKADACESMPDEVDGVKEGDVCPNNVYHFHPQVFEGRDGVGDTLERLFRLVSMAELGAIVECNLDPLTATELLTAKNELNRQENERSKRAHEQAKFEAQANQGNKPRR